MLASHDDQAGTKRCSPLASLLPGRIAGCLSEQLRLDQRCRGSRNSSAAVRSGLRSPSIEISRQNVTIISPSGILAVELTQVEGGQSFEPGHDGAGSSESSAGELFADSFRKSTSESPFEWFAYRIGNRASGRCRDDPQKVSIFGPLQTSLHSSRQRSGLPLSGRPRRRFGSWVMKQGAGECLTSCAHLSDTLAKSL